MANDNIKEVGLKFKIDGGVEFQKNIKQIKSEMDLASAEFQKATSAMDKNRDSMDYLIEKQKLYQKQVDLQRQKVNTLSSELEKLSEDEEKNAYAIAKKKLELTKAETQLNKYEKSLDEVNQKLSTSAKENQELEKELKDLGAELNQVKANYDKELSALKENATQTEKLTAKKKLLEEQEKIQEKTVEDLQKQIQLLSEDEEKNADAIAKKKLELTKAETELNNYKKDLQNTTDELKKHSKVTDEISQKLSSFGGKCTEIGKKLSVVSAAFAAVGAASIAAFNEVDDGMDTIVKATGATGESAKELEKVYKEVAGKIKGDFNSIGGAIGEINTRFGFTGDVLEKSSEDFLKFAEATNTEVVTAVQGVAKAMASANIPATEYNSILDYLTSASQVTGIGVTTLTGTLSSNGATFRELGFDVKDTIAFLSNCEAQGLDTSVAITAMKKATQAFTKEGKDASTGLKELIDRIKNAKDNTEAMSIATDYFGSKSATEMTDAIRNGRFEYEELSKT
ncbi:MAG: phage tail tape measure protein, partial [Clostridia bacterium]|nr:phage tail tape measure protein [Clostridia bacterium]